MRTSPHLQCLPSISSVPFSCRDVLCTSCAHILYSTAIFITHILYSTAIFITHDAPHRQTSNDPGCTPLCDGRRLRLMLAERRPEASPVVSSEKRRMAGNPLYDLLLPSYSLLPMSAFNQLRGASTGRGSEGRRRCRVARPTWRSGERAERQEEGMSA
jgi:hypothetical protein